MIEEASRNSRKSFVSEREGMGRFRGGFGRCLSFAGKSVVWLKTELISVNFFHFTSVVRVEL